MFLMTKLLALSKDFLFAEVITVKSKAKVKYKYWKVATKLDSYIIWFLIDWEMYEV